MRFKARALIALVLNQLAGSWNGTVGVAGEVFGTLLGPEGTRAGEGVCWSLPKLSSLPYRQCCARGPSGVEGVVLVVA
jgi:hypothetical protein